MSPLMQPPSPARLQAHAPPLCVFNVGVQLQHGGHEVLDDEGVRLKQVRQGRLLRLLPGAGVSGWAWGWDWGSVWGAGLGVGCRVLGAGVGAWVVRASRPHQGDRA
jgi:hypothetical protein